MAPAKASSTKKADPKLGLQRLPRL
uniref:Uncharacterized protein n=1 Tax=Solanum lycopersicum TaxID=4081 RepID=A0A3Q7HH20_SOLLC